MIEHAPTCLICKQAIIKMLSKEIGNCPNCGARVRMVWNTKEQMKQAIENKIELTKLQIEEQNRTSLIKAGKYDFKKVSKRSVSAEAIKMLKTFTVTTKSGTRTGDPGDFLIKDLSGELSVCSNKVFWDSYDVI